MTERPAARAALVIVVLALAACGRVQATNTTAATASSTTGNVPPTTAAEPATTTTAAVTTTTMAGLVAAPAFAVPYQFIATEVRLAKNSGIADGWIDYRSGTNQFVLFTVGGPGSVEAWLEFLTTDERMIATEPQQSNIGGQPATTVDVRLAGPSFTMFGYAPAPGENASWGILDGSVNRIHLVEFEDVTVAILIEAPQDQFEEFASAIDASLTTLEWNPAG